MSLSVADLFEDYIESLANLPSEIDQNMHEMRSMDEEFQRYRDGYMKQKRAYLKMMRVATMAPVSAASSAAPVSNNSSATSATPALNDENAQSPATPTPHPPANGSGASNVPNGTNGTSIGTSNGTSINTSNGTSNGSNTVHGPTNDTRNSANGTANVTNGPNSANPSSVSRDPAASRRQIDADYKAAVQKQDQKIDLALRMYDLVSRHIERLDKQMAQNQLVPASDHTNPPIPRASSSSSGNFSARHASAALSTSRNHLSTTSTSSSSSMAYRSSSSSSIARRKAPWVPWTRDGSRRKSLVHGGQSVSRKRAHPSMRPTPAPAPNGTPMLVHDIDPNEPRYCYCNQVSYGDMVACDGDNCEKEWFHYSCVGLTEPPDGKWFCDDCADDQQGSSTLRMKQYGAR